MDVGDSISRQTPTRWVDDTNKVAGSVGARWRKILVFRRPIKSSSGRLSAETTTKTKLKGSIRSELFSMSHLHLIGFISCQLIVIFFQRPPFLVRQERKHAGNYVQVLPMMKNA